MSTDPTHVALDKISASFDRFQEAHWWIHSIERWYHSADPFRWHLNAFLKSLKETVPLLQAELQHERGFPTWFRAQKDKLQGDELLRFLSKQRDYVVHQGMLKPGSRATIGVTEGRGIKLGISLSINPFEDSEHAMLRYLYAMAHGGSDFLGILMEDEDSLPCVQREWRLKPFEEDVVDVAAKAWLTVGEVITATVRWLGAEVPDLSLECRHSSQQVQFKIFKRKELREKLQEFREEARTKRAKKRKPVQKRATSTSGKPAATSRRKTKDV